MPVHAFPDELLPSDADLLYEEELLRNPFSLKLWWRYLEARKDASSVRRHVIYERALKALPGSYKLWHAYLKERREEVRGLCVTHPSYEALNNTYERALVTMHKMPRIWVEYLTLLSSQERLVTRARRTFDKALRSLPVTQHDRVWALYLAFVRSRHVPVDTALRVYRRYIMLEPGAVEDYIEYLVAAGCIEEAAQRMADCLNDADFVSQKGKTKHQLWLELCELVTKNATKVRTINVDGILRAGIRKYSQEVGRLWTSLSDYYIRKGLFEKARDMYDEGLTTVTTVRDFSLVFDAYTQYEESLVSAKMEQLAAAEEEEGDEGEGEEDWNNESVDLDLHLARLEHLMQQRPLLLNSVLLRQNPHNVAEWHKRVKLYAQAKDVHKQILTFTEAVKTVDPAKAAGKPHTLWTAFAQLYESHGDLANARVIFDKATQVPFKAVDDLACVWCEWAEMELRHNNFTEALDLMRRATQEPDYAQMRRDRVTSESKQGAPPPVQTRLHKSLKLWSFYVDLEESLGTLATVRPLYDRILELRIATPQIIINYAHLLEENKFFDDSFRVYERGVAAFKYPHVKDIWTIYLTKFVARYGGKKLERARDLFEQALAGAPPAEARPLYLQYAKLEEDYGLGRHAMAIYDRAMRNLPEEERLGVFDIYVARATQLFGISKTREIYESAIESGLADKDVKAVCLRYAALERKLGEIDRARAIFCHAAQLADPRTDTIFWEQWHQFEVGGCNAHARLLQMGGRVYLACLSQVVGWTRLLMCLR
eukprot:jgi/Mesvir1/9838/Mv22381-RA.2